MGVGIPGVGYPGDRVSGGRVYLGSICPTPRVEVPTAVGTHRTRMLSLFVSCFLSYLSELFQIEDERRQRRYHRSPGLQQQTRHYRLPVVTTRNGTPASWARSRTPSATPSRTPSPDRGRRFRLPVVTNRSGTPTNRVRPRSPSRTPPSPDRQEYLQNPPSYEGVSQRPEEHPSDTGPPPPSYEEVMTGSFTEIQIEGSDECANQRQEQSPDSHRSV